MQKADKSSSSIKGKCVKIGDVIEFDVAKGFAYAQHTHEDKDYGYLIRVFDRVFQERPADFDSLVKLPVQFVVFFPINSAARQGYVRIVGHAPVSEGNKTLPRFRLKTPNRQTREVDLWFEWLGDGNYVRLDPPPSDLKSMAILGVCNVDCLVDRVNEGWRAETAKW